MTSLIHFSPTFMAIELQLLKRPTTFILLKINWIKVFKSNRQCRPNKLTILWSFNNSIVYTPPQFPSFQISPNLSVQTWSVCTIGLSKNMCKNVRDCEHVMERGWMNRSTGSTLMNADSSRSHSIFTIHLERCEADAKGEEHVRAAKLNLVDLAGSERQSKTGRNSLVSPPHPPPPL